MSDSPTLPVLRTPSFVQMPLPAAGDTAGEIHAALAAPSASIAPRFFYDELGSRLFAAIMALPEYYPTRTEAAIVEQHLPEIAEAARIEGGTLVDLGAGTCEKAARLFDALKPAQYAAVDISADFLRASLDCLQRQFPAMAMLGVGTDFSRVLTLPGEVSPHKRLFFYPGSSIGNFTPDDAVAFLTQLREHGGADGALLIGVDLVKPSAVLEPAYDDALGVTAAFNLNVLVHLNRIAGTDFHLRDWRHLAYFNERDSRIEMHLEATRSLEVRWRGGRRRFEAGECIHTENSYKYTPQSFAALLARAGYAPPTTWTDAQGWFGLFLARPR